MGLQEEISEKSSQIKTDFYSMSIGELISLYKDGEMDIHPEFQRVYRWTGEQKTRLIESILLGIPLPPIFVATRKDGVWDIVDGVQRLSTIFQFAGILKGENNELLPPLVLEPTKFLPSLEGMQYEGSAENTLDPAQRIQFKRSKISVNLILKESDPNSKYELFQRLNTGGTPLSEQEVRNCLLLMENKKIYEFLKKLSESKDFVEVVALTDRLTREKHDMELVLRFILLRKIPLEGLRIGHVADYLTEKMLLLDKETKFNFEEEEEAFNKTFKLLNDVLQSDSFRRYDRNKNKFLGPFLVSAFEVVGMGIGFNVNNWKIVNPNLKNLIEGIWEKRDFLDRSGSGVSASGRIPVTLKIGREVFKNS